MNRHGFTLTELLMAMTVMAILGVGFTRILINDSRFVSRQDAVMSARQGARQAMHTMIAELEMISDSGLIADSAKKIVARVPFAFGVLCRRTGGVTTAAILPTDSLTFNSALASGAPIGVAYNVAGFYNRAHATTITVAPSVATAQCTADSIRVLTGTPAGKLIDITVTPASALMAASSGSIFYLYQMITYSFANSTDPTLSGRKALFRQVGALAPEELVAPFDTSAGFRCLTLAGAALSAVNCPVADPATVRGVELRLVSASDKPPQGTSQPLNFNLTTRVVFNNR